jgi:hypothetical protein
VRALRMALVLDKDAGGAGHRRRMELWRNCRCAQRLEIKNVEGFRLTFVDGFLNFGKF